MERRMLGEAQTIAWLDTLLIIALAVRYALMTFWVWLNWQRKPPAWTHYGF